MHYLPDANDPGQGVFEYIISPAILAIECNTFNYTKTNRFLLITLHLSSSIDLGPFSNCGTRYPPKLKLSNPALFSCQETTFYLIEQMFGGFILLHKSQSASMIAQQSWSRLQRALQIRLILTAWAFSCTNCLRWIVHLFFL